MIDKDKEDNQLLFNKHYTDIDINTNIEITTKIFCEHFDFEYKDIKPFIISGISQYNDISYHNALHGLNTLYAGSVFLKIVSYLNINRNFSLIFLICCYLHDIGHPGIGSKLTDQTVLECLHLQLIKKLVEQYNDILQIDNQYLYTFDKLIFATNLSFHDKFLNEFILKYFTETGELNTEINKEIGLIELCILIKMADLSASYKKYKIFEFGSGALEKEVLASGISKYDKKMEDLLFLKKFSIPLAKYCSDVFPQLRFMYQNALKNGEILENKK